jgi:hypothetical protein
LDGEEFGDVGGVVGGVDAGGRRWRSGGAAAGSVRAGGQQRRAGRRAGSSGAAVGGRRPVEKETERRKESRAVLKT